MGIKVLCVTEHVFTRDTFFLCSARIGEKLFEEKKPTMLLGSNREPTDKQLP